MVFAGVNAKAFVAMPGMRTERRIAVTERRRAASVVRLAAASEKAAPVLPYRIGHGWDLHRLEPGYVRCATCYVLHATCDVLGGPILHSIDNATRL